MGELILGLVFAGVVFGPPVVIGFAVGWVVRGRKMNQSAVVTEHRRLEVLVDQIQHDAYEHMTLGDGTLAPIVIDSIRNSERHKGFASPVDAPQSYSQLPPERLS